MEGARLTESGLSLGTPQYMSPEQATGARQLDARSDIYSLAAVFYEMMAGEPPVSGPSAQAMIAKLLTERPTPLSVLRDTVPPNASDAVAKALAKTPADRYSTAGAFVAAVQAGFAPTAAAPARARGARSARRLVVGSVAAGIVAIGSLAAIAAMRHRPAAFVLGDRIQLTTSGDVLAPAISGDGKQLAYYTKHCDASGCSYSVVIQDVGGTAKRTILDSATEGYSIDWSPDRRNLLLDATVNGVSGRYVLSTLGGAPRLVTNVSYGALATFFAGGDSLLISSGLQSDSIYWIRVASLDGVARDSIRVNGPRNGGAEVLSIPGTPWLLVWIVQPALRRTSSPTVIDRHGSRVGEYPSTGWCAFGVSTDALWEGSCFGGPAHFVRIPIDPATGHVGTARDTMLVPGTGGSPVFSVTADGTALVMNQGNSEYSVWALSVADALAGRFDDTKRIDRASVRMTAGVSHDGARLLIDRTFPLPSGGMEHHLSVMPFGGGIETAVTTQGRIDAHGWIDSVTQALASITSKGRRVVLHDTRTGAEREETYIPDSLLFDFDHVPGGWAWLPWGGDRVTVRVGGQTREYPKPPWFAMMLQTSADAEGHRLALSGFGASDQDSLGVYVLSLDSGAATRWAAFRGDGEVRWNEDGSLFAEVYESRGRVTFYRIPSPGRVEKIGSVPREVLGIVTDRKTQHAAVLTEDVHGDAWLLRVIRR